MEQDFYAEYAQIEDVHWWFRGRRSIFDRLLAELPVVPGGRRILDIGFATGATLTFMSAYGNVVGMDRSDEAIKFARTRCSQPMFIGDITAVPLHTGAVDLVTAFDILEHVDDDGAAIAELARVCKPRGHALLTVPAFQFLWGNQDVVSRHRRRYTARDLRQRVEAAGFQIRRLSYFNTLLFPVIAAVRVARRLRGGSNGPVKSDFTMTKPGLVNDALSGVFAAEGALLTRFRLPVGASLVCLAERRA